MFKTVRGRLITIFLVILVAGWQLHSHGLKLGLDLQGGMHIVEEVDDPHDTMSSAAKRDAIDRAKRIVQQRIDELGVVDPLVQTAGDDRLIVELPGVTSQKRAESIINEEGYLEFNLVRPTTDMEKALPRMDRAVVNALGVDSIRRMGKAGQAAAAPQEGGKQLEKLLFGADTAHADTTKGGKPGAKSRKGPAAAAQDSAQKAEQEAEAMRPLTALLDQGDYFGTFFVAAEDVPTVEEFLKLPDVQRSMPRGEELLWGQHVVARGGRNYKRLYVLESRPFLTGSYLDNATAVRDPQNNQSEVQFTLNRAGGRLFERFTAQHVGDYLAIVLDDQVMSAPVIQSRIGARGQIEMGNSPMADAQDLALVLRAGALPTKLNIMSESTVGPSLGKDSIEQGKIAGLLGVILVVFIMVGYYRMAGLLAVLALGVYVVILMGTLAGFDSTLTVPGIAGIVLSIGMAVDANVLIFERIREELAAGRATRTAVDEGFIHAMPAIVDSNITTLITGLILFQFGTGPVKGFAVTLTIGIVASFFSAIFVTRTFFLLYLRRKKASDPISI